MRILVTGAGGFLGSAVLRVARAAGLSAIGSGRTGTEYDIDLEDPCALLTALDRLRPSAIINCAVRAEFGSGVLANLYGVNVLAPALMAGWTAKTQGRLIHASATLVHGSRAEQVDENSPVNPDTDYGRSKALAEELIRASGCKAAIVRLAGIFGKGGPEHLGLNRAIREATAGRPPVLKGTGSARRNYVYVDDAASALVHCATSGLSGTFHLAGPEGHSIGEMLEMVCEVFLPGTRPVVSAGKDGPSQIVNSSAVLPPGRSFRAALLNEASMTALD